ncbi:MAG TPA: cyclic nucleotide-binding domain-containing protein [Burkholderiaceae bacterium]|nr:cyclic nucleotide-binding domain-containing protein [Burkholderiaceae bacterium]HQR76067.1 cyclic nucleotide-binding domain-containing protein [Burkholderiaceae bacterium]
MTTVNALALAQAQPIASYDVPSPGHGLPPARGIPMTAQTSTQTLLARHPFTYGMGGPAIEKLATLARNVSFARNEVIFREGDDIHDFFLVVTGRVALEIVSEGVAHRVHTLSAGDELGWSAVLMGQGKYFQARALEQVGALAFDGRELLTLCESEPAFGFKLMHRLLGVVAERLQATRLQLLDTYWPVAHKAGA